MECRMEEAVETFGYAPESVETVAVIGVSLPFACMYRDAKKAGDVVVLSRCTQHGPH